MYEDGRVDFFFIDISLSHLVFIKKCFFPAEWPLDLIELFFFVFLVQPVMFHLVCVMSNELWVDLSETTDTRSVSKSSELINASSFLRRILFWSYKKMDWGQDQPEQPR